MLTERVPYVYVENVEAASPPVRPSGWMSVAPAVSQWTAAGPCGMAGGISSVDCSACSHGGAMGAGSDFI